MSVRTYGGVVPSRRRSRSTALPAALATLVVLAQIAYPLLSGEPLRLLTIATVVLFFAASVTHAWLTRGAWWALGLVVVTAGGGFLAEAVGVATGYPFGEYAYAGSLGPRLLHVPVVVPLAWTMMAYPCLVVARRLLRERAPALVPLVAGFALAAWDVFLDPQMVAAGHWTWAHPTPALPGVPGIPLTNFAGWLLVAVAMMALLSLLPDSPRAPVGVPVTLFLWTWLGSVVGNAVFFDRPSVALVGGIAMGLVGLPLLWSLWQTRD